MKTQVIQLVPHDDVTSVRDKMAWAKTPRILLVFPHHSRILSRTLDLRLLRRHAATLGAQLAIVTRSGDLRRIAQAVGIPAFNTVASAQRKTWEGQPLAEKPRRRTRPPDLRQMRHAAFPGEAHWRTLLGFRLLFFLLGILAVLALLFLFVPSATIQLSPETKIQSLTIPVSASIDSLAVTQLVTGKSPEEAARRFSESFPLATVPDIQVKPSWWPWLPIVPFRITISTGD
jgi:hypothetical protein